MRQKRQVRRGRRAAAEPPLKVHCNFNPSRAYDGNLRQNASRGRWCPQPRAHAHADAHAPAVEGETRDLRNSKFPVIQ